MSKRVLGYGSVIDVQDLKHAYYKVIYWVAGAGIIKGYSVGMFGINENRYV